VNHSQGAAPLRVGLVINPWAGVGGPAGLRGSDGDDIRREAVARGSLPRASERVRRFLAALGPVVGGIRWLAWGGAMGADSLAGSGAAVTVLGWPAAEPSAAADTREAAGALLAAGIDLLVFAGGDGTARDVCAAVGTRVPVIGLPAGVKMYSGVFAVSPEAAADVVARLASGRPVPLETGDVRDIDEEAFRHDRVQSRHFGDMLVAGSSTQLQHVKCGTPLDEALVRDDIAAGVLERLEPGQLCLVGTGTTPAAILQAMGLEGSLLGIDAVCDGRLVASDLDAGGILRLLDAYPSRCLVVTATGGQGFVLGRGNQQLSPDVVRRVGVENLVIIATPAKLAALQGRALCVDTGDLALDHELAGLRPVWTGFSSRVLYPLRAVDALAPEGVDSGESEACASVPNPP